MDKKKQYEKQHIRILSTCFYTMNIAKHDILQHEINNILQNVCSYISTLGNAKIIDSTYINK